MQGVDLASTAVKAALQSSQVDPERIGHVVVGGVIMLWAERRQHVIRAETVDDMTWKDAVKIGFAQCLAMIPGTSRSGSTIIGGLLFGLSRKAAT